MKSPVPNKFKILIEFKKTNPVTDDGEITLAYTNNDMIGVATVITLTMLQDSRFREAVLLAADTFRGKEYQTLLNSNNGRKS